MRDCLRYIRAVACITGAPVLGHSALRIMSGPTVNGRGGRDDADRRFGTLKSVCVRRIGTREVLAAGRTTSCQAPVVYARAEVSV